VIGASPKRQFAERRRIGKAIARSSGLLVAFVAMRKRGILIGSPDPPIAEA